MKIRQGPDGIHLFNRDSGLNILFDERVVAHSEWTLSPRQVSIALTNACDLTCSHCYASKYKATLNVYDIQKWLIELDNIGCLGVGFGGGEPTLYPELISICEFAREHTDMAISITTHGHRLTDSLLNQLEGKLDFIRVSMDGVHSTYESIRKKPFDTLLKNIKRLSNVIPFGINYVVNDKTINDLNFASQIAEELGASELLLLPEVNVGKGSKISVEAFEQLKLWISSYKGAMRLSSSAENAEAFAADLALKKEPKWLAFAHIDASGELKNSSFDFNGVKIGSNGFESAFASLNKQELEGLV